MRLLGLTMLAASLALIQCQDAVLSHFDFGTYPDLSSVLSAEPAQPKQTGASNAIRYSILFPDMVCRLARGKITRVKILVPSGSTGLDLQIQIWRRNPSETFTLVETITKVVNSAGSLILEDSIDFTDLFMEFNDVIGIWLPWKYPLAAVSGVGRSAMFIARYTGPGSNTFDQNPPPVGSEEPLSFNGISAFYLALEIELENQKGDGREVLKVPFEALPVVETDDKQAYRVKRQVAGPTTHVYSVGVKGDKGAQGQQGLTGNQGAAGDKGIQGATGFVGVKGSKGEVGEAGEDGSNRPGATGSTGVFGLEGPEGPQGATGSSGAKGDMGVVGVKGLVGLPGLQGNKGSQGVKGEQGLQGMPGVEGPAGDPGSPGDVGTPGEQGETGEQGSRGSEGGSLQDVIDAAPDCGGVNCINGTCQQTLVGPMCKCNEGYEFATGDNSTCSDANECLLPVCDQMCVNIDGGYTCRCMSGYTLQSDRRTCTRDTGTCSCGEEESCELLASGNQCLPSTIAVSSRGGIISARQSSVQQDVPVEQTAWVSENWVIIFIVWGIVLTILTLILGIWLVYENRNSSYDNGTDYDNRSHLTGSLGPNGMILTPLPASNSMAGRYSTGAPTFAQLQYNAQSREMDIYN